MIEALASGTLLGLAAGISPGPLLALVVSETLRSGAGGGVRVSLAPLLTDLPIVLIAVLLLGKLSGNGPVLGLISITGGAFMLYLGYKNLKTTGPGTDTLDAGPDALIKGMLINALSPHPYLFWATVGGPLIIKFWNSSHINALAFAGAFYLFLVGSKVFIAVLTAVSRAHLEGGRYIIAMRLLGASLIVFSILLFQDGFNYFRLAGPGNL